MLKTNGAPGDLACRLHAGFTDVDHVAWRAKLDMLIRIQTDDAYADGLAHAFDYVLADM